MPTIGLEVAIVIILILLNGVLAMSEMAIVSSRKARLHQLAEDGDKGAKTALIIAGAPTDFLSTVQIGITLVGVFAGAFGGATIAGKVAEKFALIPMLVPYAHAIAMTLVVGATTFLSLIIGELVPKRLALHAPEKVARFVAAPMNVISRFARPLVFLLSTSTNFILKLCGITDHTDPQVTEAEIHILVEQAAEAGIVEEAEHEMVNEVLRLGDRRVKSLMTPRIDLVWLGAEDTTDEILQTIESTPHTRFPVGEESLDVVLGVVESKTILANLVRHNQISLRESLVQPLFVPENTTALDLLERFRDSGVKMALVLNEYGGLQGMVTSDDIFQCIVGDRHSQGSEPKWEATKREDGSWLLDGQIPIEEFERIFELKAISDDENQTFQTLAGFILAQLEHIPVTGEKFEWKDFEFEIIDLDRHRIDKVLVTRKPAPAAPH